MRRLILFASLCWAALGTEGAVFAYAPGTECYAVLEQIDPEPPPYNSPQTVGFFDRKSASQDRYRFLWDPALLATSAYQPLSFWEESVGKAEGGCVLFEGYFHRSEMGGESYALLKGATDEVWRLKVYAFFDRPSRELRHENLSIGTLRMDKGHHFDTIRMQAQSKPLVGHGGHRGPIAGTRLDEPIENVRSKIQWIQPFDKPDEIIAVLCSESCAALKARHVGRPVGQLATDQGVGPPPVDEGPQGGGSSHREPLEPRLLVTFEDESGLPVPKSAGLGPASLIPKGCALERLPESIREALGYLYSTQCFDLDQRLDWELIDLEPITEGGGLRLKATVRPEKYRFITGVTVRLSSGRDAADLSGDCGFGVSIAAADGQILAMPLRIDRDSGKRPVGLSERRDEADGLGIDGERLPWLGGSLLLQDMPESKCEVVSRKRFDLSDHASDPELEIDDNGRIFLSGFQFRSKKPALLVYLLTFTGRQSVFDATSVALYPWKDQEALRDSVYAFVLQAMETLSGKVQSVQVVGVKGDGSYGELLDASMRDIVPALETTAGELSRDLEFVAADFSQVLLQQEVVGRLDDQRFAGLPVRVLILGRSGFPDNLSYCDQLGLPDEPEVSYFILDYAAMSNVLAQSGRGLSEYSGFPIVDCDHPSFNHWVAFPQARSFLRWRLEMMEAIKSFLRQP